MDIKIPSHQQFVWEYWDRSQSVSKDPVMLSWDGKPVYKRKSRYLDNFRVLEFIDSLPKETKEDIYDLNVPDILYVDIETEIIDGFPEPSLAEAPVTCIGYFYSNTKEATVTGTTWLSTQQIKNIERRIKEHFSDKTKFNMEGFTFKYVYFEKEYEMIYDFFANWTRNCNFMTGWNFITFDWLYLVNRAKRLEVDYTLCAEPNAIGDESRYYPVKHKIVTDYMDMFKKYGLTFIEVQESMKLDYIAECVVGANKIKYNGSLQDLYIKDYETYVFYNIVDTMLVKFINDKTDLINSFCGIGNQTKIETLAAVSPVRLTEAILCLGYLEENKVIPYKKRMYDFSEVGGKKKKASGGFVKEPVPGYYEMILGTDFASLYPSIMMMLNLSPETYMGKELDEEILKSQGIKYIKTPIDTFFSSDKTGVLKKIMISNYGQRKAIQAEMKDIEKRISDLEKSLK